MQRHHLIPRQLLSAHCFCRFFDAVGRTRLGFEDFRRNGVLLPARDEAAARAGLPLHRGPHRAYTEIVAERVGRIEAGWAATRRHSPELALTTAQMRIDLLQRALRRRLLSTEGPRMRLNRRDPLGSGLDFSTLDAMADALWADTAPALVH